MGDDFKGFKKLLYVQSDIIEALVKIILNGEDIKLTGTLEDGQVLMRILDGSTHYWTNRTPGYPEGPDISGKVDKITGKGLSTEDFTTALKNLLNQQSNTNTGDETYASIIDKLGLESPIVTQGDLTAALLDYVLKETGKSLILDTEIARLALIKQNVYAVNLPTGDVSERAAGATGGTGTTGWTYAAAANPNDLQITHNLGRKITYVDVSYIDGTSEIQLLGNLAYTGREALSSNVLVIKGLSTKAFPLTIQLIFA